MESGGREGNATVSWCMFFFFFWGGGRGILRRMSFWMFVFVDLLILTIEYSTVIDLIDVGVFKGPRRGEDESNRMFLFPWGCCSWQDQNPSDHQSLCYFIFGGS